MSEQREPIPDDPHLRKAARLIREIVDGNNATADDVRLNFGVSERMRIRADVRIDIRLDLDAEWQRARPEGAGACTVVEDARAGDRVLRARFEARRSEGALAAAALADLRQSPRCVLASQTRTRDLERYDGVAWLETCGGCEGRGRVACHDDCRSGKKRCGFCQNGWNRCHVCGGTNNREYVRGSRRVRESCPHCRRGWTKCGHCDRHGWVTCKRCWGAGKVDCDTCQRSGQVYKLPVYSATARVNKSAAWVDTPPEDIDGCFSGRSETPCDLIADLADDIGVEQARDHDGSTLQAVVLGRVPRSVVTADCRGVEIDGIFLGRGLQGWVTNHFLDDLIGPDMRAACTREGEASFRVATRARTAAWLTRKALSDKDPAFAAIRPEVKALPLTGDRIPLFQRHMRAQWDRLAERPIRRIWQIGVPFIVAAGTLPWMFESGVVVTGYPPSDAERLLVETAIFVTPLVLVGSLAQRVGGAGVRARLADLGCGDVAAGARLPEPPKRVVRRYGGTAFLAAVLLCYAGMANVRPGPEEQIYVMERPVAATPEQALERGFVRIARHGERLVVAGYTAGREAVQVAYAKASDQIDRVLN